MISYNSDRQSYWHGASTTSEGGSFTCSGTNRFLLVTIVEYASNNCSGVTYNGVAMTKITGISADGGRYLTSWYLFNPASGAHTLTASFNTSVYGPSVYCESYSGAKQTSGFGNYTSNSGSGTAISATLTPPASGWVIMNWRDDTGQTATAGANTTLRVANEGLADTNGNKTGSTTLTANVASSCNWYCIAFTLYEEATAPAGRGATLLYALV